MVRGAITVRFSSTDIRGDVLNSCIENGPRNLALRRDHHPEHVKGATNRRSNNEE